MWVTPDGDAVGNFFLARVGLCDMVDTASVGLVALGVVVLLMGAVLSRYGIALLGAAVGGGGGFVLAPALGFGAPTEMVAATAAGVVVGVVVVYLVLSIAIALLAFSVGTYVGASTADVVLEEPELAVTAAFALAVGLVAAFLGTILKRSVMIVVTSIIGAALASRSVTLEDLDSADIFISLEDPLFLGLFALGVLTQFGLFRFGYVTKIVSYLPGAGVLRDNEDGTEG